MTPIRISPVALLPYTLLLTALSDHLIRPHQHIGWNGEADLLGGFQVDHELKLHRLLHRQVVGRSAFQNLVDVGSGAAEHVGSAWPIGHETTGLGKLAIKMYCWQAALCGKLRDPYSLIGYQRAAAE
jgi:hypothetical protein